MAFYYHTNYNNLATGLKCESRFDRSWVPDTTQPRGPWTHHAAREAKKTWAQRVLNASSDCSGLTSLICLYACLSALYVTLWLSKPLIDLNSKNLMFRLFRHIGAALSPFSPEAKILWITSSCYRSQNRPEQRAGSCLTSDLWPVIDSHTEAWFTQATIDLIFGRKGPVWIQLFPKCVFFHIKCFNSWMF